MLKIIIIGVIRFKCKDILVNCIKIKVLFVICVISEDIFICLYLWWEYFWSLVYILLCIFLIIVVVKWLDV